MTIRVYTDKGKEFFARLGQIVPAGYFTETFEPLEIDHIVNYYIDEGNPWDQYSKDKKKLVLIPKK